VSEERVCDSGRSGKGRRDVKAIRIDSGPALAKKTGRPRNFFWEKRGSICGGEVEVTALFLYFEQSGKWEDRLKKRKGGTDG